MDTAENNSQQSSELRILQLWQRFNSYPFGRSIFNFLIGWIVPYSGTVKPRIIHLEPGTVTVEMNDRRIVRNHLKSIHAIALANIGEFASGLAMLSALPDNVKAIVTHLEIDYKKKARGMLRVEGRAAPPVDINDDVETIVNARIYDADKDEVAELRVTWRLRPKDLQKQKGSSR